VKAKTHHKWKNLIFQRIRWAGDANIMWKFNKFFFVIILSTFLSNLFILILLLIKNYYPLVILLLIKFILENMIYTLGSKKINMHTNQLSFVLWFFIQIPYIVFMGLTSFFVNNLSWRGRRAQ